MSPFDQHAHKVRCEWGPLGLATLAPISDVVIVIDVLSFTTSVDIVVANGGRVLPYRFDDDTAHAHAARHNALLATRGGPPGSFSLSPSSLVAAPPDTDLVLPSPNGSTLCFDAVAAGATTVFAGCLRNARAVAEAAMSTAGPDGAIALIAAGERWKHDPSQLRPALEDWLGAGAIASHLSHDSMSPETRAAIAAFRAVEQELLDVLTSCSSGVELFEMRRGDPPIAAQLDASTVAPRLDGVYLSA